MELTFLPRSASRTVPSGVTLELAVIVASSSIASVVGSTIGLTFCMPSLNRTMEPGRFGSAVAFQVASRVFTAVWSPPPIAVRSHNVVVWPRTWAMSWPAWVSTSARGWLAAGSVSTPVRK